MSSLRAKRFSMLAVQLAHEAFAHAHVQYVYVAVAHIQALQPQAIMLGYLRSL